MCATITVSEGDTLYKLSLMYSISPSRLRVINNLGIHDVHPGDVLKIESPLEYLSSRHHLAVMLISSSDFFKEDHNSIHDDNSNHNNNHAKVVNEFTLLKSAISGSVVLTDDLLVFNQLQTNNILNKERYTFFINLIAISNTNLVPFYKHFPYFKSQSNEEKQPQKSSFFKRLFSSKSETNEKKQDEDNTNCQKVEHNLDEPEIDNDNSQQKKTFKVLHNQTNINFNGVETFSSQYIDEPSVLELCFYNDPLNKSLGIKSISFFASRAELNSLDFLINFFSRQRRIEIGLRLVTSNDLPVSDQKNDSKSQDVKAVHTSSMFQLSSFSVRKTSMINMIHDQSENLNDFGISDIGSNRNYTSTRNLFYLDENGTFGCAIQKTVMFIPEDHVLPKKCSNIDKTRKIGSFTSETNFTSSPIFSPQPIIKSTLSCLAPISCNSLTLSNSVIPDPSSSFFTDTFSYSQYPASLTDSTSMILDCVNITMIRLHFPHRILGSSWRLAFRLSRDGCSFHTLLDRTREGHSCVLSILTSKGESIGAFLANGIHEGKCKSGGGGSFVFSFTPPKKKSKNKAKTSNISNNNSNDNFENDSNNNNNNNNNDDDDNSESNTNNNSSNTNTTCSNHTMANSSISSTYFSRRNANIYKWSMLNDKFVIVSTTDLMIGSTSISSTKDSFKDRSRLFSDIKSSIGGLGAAIWIDQKMNKGISEKCPTFNSPPLVESGTFTVNDIEVWNII